MSPFEVVAMIITIFFGFGIAMGVLIVVTLPVIKRHCEERRRMYSNHRRYLGDDGWQEPPSDRDGDEKPPRWLGG